MSSAASRFFRSPLMTLLENFPEEKQSLCLRNVEVFTLANAYMQIYAIFLAWRQRAIQESAAPEAFSRLGLHHHEKSTLPASRRGKVFNDANGEEVTHTSMAINIRTKGRRDTDRLCVW